MYPLWKTLLEKSKNGKAKGVHVGFEKNKCEISALSKHKQCSNVSVNKMSFKQSSLTEAGSFLWCKSSFRALLRA